MRYSPYPSLLAFITSIAFLVGGLRYGSSQTSSPAARSAVAYRVAGTVISKADGHPLARDRVALADVKDRRKIQTTFSTEDGKFEFTGVLAGKYSLEAARRGFLPASYEQHGGFSTAIVTGADVDTENLRLPLSPAAVIVGRVLDEAGDAVRHAQVRLYRVNHGAGVKQVQPFRGMQTNDLGSFEFARLLAGTYYLSAQATPWYAVHPQEGGREGPTQVDPALDVAYPITFYADTSDFEAASPITIGDGGRVEVDIHLAPIPALRAIFHLSGAGSNSFPQLLQVGPAGEIGAGMVQGAAAQTVSPGVWEISGIPAGRYNILVPGGAGSVGQSATVDLVNDLQEVNTSGSEFSRVKLSVQVAGQRSVPRGLGVFFRSNRGTMRGGQAIAESGEAQLDIVPGRYEVTVAGSDKAYSIARISASGCEVSGHTVSLSSGLAAISLIVVEGVARVEGVVKLGDKPLAGAMIVLVPKDPAGNRSLFRRDQSDLDGTFALNSVFPGSYTVVAIQDGWDLDWSEPEVISTYLKRGQRLEVGSHETRPIALSQPIEAQPR